MDGIESWIDFICSSTQLKGLGVWTMIVNLWNSDRLFIQFVICWEMQFDWELFEIALK